MGGVAAGDRRRAVDRVDRDGDRDLVGCRFRRSRRRRSRHGRCPPHRRVTTAHKFDAGDATRLRWRPLARRGFRGLVAAMTLLCSRSTCGHMPPGGGGRPVFPSANPGARAICDRRHVSPIGTMIATIGSAPPGLLAAVADRLPFEISTMGFEQGIQCARPEVSHLACRCRQSNRLSHESPGGNLSDCPIIRPSSGSPPPRPRARPARVGPRRADGADIR